jgi:hypothetical protein
MRIKSKIIKIIATVIISSIFPFSAYAVMQSSSYRIYENVLQEFDGPVISTVAATAGETTATVSWDTDVVSDGFVIYDTVAGFTSPKEQGSSAKVSTSQSVSLVGLTAATTYYYRARSTSLYGGSTTDGTVRSFTTSASTVVPPTPPAGGGGVLIIDKRDKTAPTISALAVSNVLSDSATIAWKTDEKANSFVTYGKTQNYGQTSGTWDSVDSHSVTLIGLNPLTKYFFRALSADESGNLASSTESSFTTLSLEEEIKQATTTPGNEPTPDNLAAALEKARQIIEKFSTTVSIDVLRTDLTAHLNALEFINRLLPSPSFNAEPKVEVDTTSAIISWQTSLDSSSQVAFAPESGYKADAAEPYNQIIGNADERVTNHSVKIINLQMDTLYHYQLRSKATVGPQAVSRDFTFRTKKEGLEIVSYTVKVLTPESAQFRWITSAETDSSLRIMPYRGNQLAVDEAKTFSSDLMSLIHETLVNNLEGGTVYYVELSGKDANGRVVSKVIDTFTTSKDNMPPEIGQVRTDSVIIPGKEDLIQVIITWQTNEPSTSQVYFQRGIAPQDKDPTEKTQLDQNYTKRHVIVIPRLEPGQVYSFKVESADSGGSASKSQLYSILAPKKKETIFDIILRILTETFGWIGDIGN